MPHNRFFYPHPFQKDETVRLSAEESRHLIQVMRVAKGDTVELVNGLGEVAIASLQSQDKEGASLKIVSFLSTPPPPCRLILNIALLVPAHLEFVLEKGTELGVDTIRLFPAALSVKKDVSPLQMKRYGMIILSSLKQSGRSFIPKIELSSSLFDLNFSDLSFYGDVRPEAKPLWSLFPESPKCMEFVVGPESGFTMKEIQWLEENHVKGASLHKNTLRAETAAIVALTHMSRFL